MRDEMQANIIEVENRSVSMRNKLPANTTAPGSKCACTQA